MDQNIEFSKLSNVTSSNTTNTTTTNNNSSSNNNLQGKENTNTIFNMNMDIKHGIINASASSDITHNKKNKNVNHNNTNIMSYYSMQKKRLNGFETSL